MNPPWAPLRAAVADVDLELALEVAYGHAQPPPLSAPAPRSCAKTGYATKDEVKAAARRVWRAGRGAMRYYLCPACRHWHLSHRPAHSP